MSRVSPAEANLSARGRRHRLLPWVALAVVAVLAAAPERAAAHEAAAEENGHSLEVVVGFPDSGLANGEQLCLGLYPQATTDFAAPPLLSRCLDPGQESATFEGIDHGEFVVAVPGAGSKIDGARYQGQLVETAVPDEANLAAFGIDVELSLAPEAAGTTGRVQVNVYGCPEGTEQSEDAEFWASECRALVGDVPLSLSGLGTIGDTEVQEVTGLGGLASGRALFTNLPAGAYQLEGDLPGNLGSPAVFIQSSIEGGVRPIGEDGRLDLRPTETVAIDVYLVLDGQDSATVATPTAASPQTTVLGFGDPAITGGVADSASPDIDE